MKFQRSIAARGLLAFAWVTGVTPAVAAEALAYVTNQGDGVTVIDLATLKPVRTITVGKDPRGIGITPDGRLLVTANQGDEDLSVVDAASGKTLHRVAIGKNAEFVRVGPDGHFAYVTYEPSSSGKPTAKEEKGDSGKPGKAEPDEGSEPAEIAVVDLSKFLVTMRLPASLETEGMDFSPDGRQLVVANEGDDSVVVYDLGSGRSVKKIDIAPYGKRPRGVKFSPDGSMVLVTLESSDNFLVMDARYNVVKAVPTGKGPYGVAFEPGGARAWIAAARSEQIQVLDAKTFVPLVSIPVGKRCWHFSFTPDGKKALAACGRSDAVTVIDVPRLEPVSTLTGFHQPWGIVTYPKASGSLDSPAYAR